MPTSRLDNQAPVLNKLENESPRVSRSVFNYSHVHSGTAMIGALTPVLTMETVPNEDIDINLSALVSLRNPLVRPLLNGMRVYFHGVHNMLVDLWEGAKNFIDLGRSGKISLPRPNLVYRITSSGGGRLCNAATPMSLLDYLGLPPQLMQTKYDVDGKPFPPLYSFVAAARDNDWTDYSVILANAPSFFPADVCMAYQRNWRDRYANKNLLQNNKYWFPDNEDDFILSYSCTDAVVIKHGDEMLGNDYNAIVNSLRPNGAIDVFSTTPEPNNPCTYATPGQDFAAPNLSGLKFVQFKGDRFTQGSPFPELLRGDVPVLSDFHSLLGDRPFYYSVAGLDTLSPVVTPAQVVGDGNGGLRATKLPTGLPANGEAIVPSNVSKITLNDIRALETFTVFKERMARTNGDYNNMIEAQYGYNPHHHDRTGDFIGGFYCDFNFSTVVQQSQSTDDSPLGTKAGDGNAVGQGRIGHYHTRDFGWLSVYMFIVPDVMYTQGLQRQYQKKIQSDMYFPIFNNLAPQPIKTSEIFISGDATVDDMPFSFEDRFAEYKSAMNRVSGFMRLPHSVAEFDASRIMARRFERTPSFNSQFVTLVPENVDMSVFSVQDEPPFDFQIGFNITRVSPMPYIAVPGSLSSNLHA